MYLSLKDNNIIRAVRYCLSSELVCESKKSSKSGNLSLRNRKLLFPNYFEYLENHLRLKRKNSFASNIFELKFNLVLVLTGN